MKNTYFKEIFKSLPKIKYVEYAKFEQYWAITPHIDKIHEIMYIVNGSCTLWTKEYEIKGKKNDIIYIPANTFHKDIFSENSNLKVYFIRFYMKDINISPMSVLNLSEKSKNIIKKEFNNIMNDFKINNNIANISLFKILSIIDTNLKDSHTQSNDYNDFIEKIKNIIKNKYNTNISLETLSQELDKSTYHISHIFNKYNDIKLSEYIIKVKMEKATELLMNSNLNISQIAYKIGFKDPHYFTNVFKSYYNITPKEYRQTYNTKEI